MSAPITSALDDLLVASTRLHLDAQTREDRALVSNGQLTHEMLSKDLKPRLSAVERELTPAIETDEARRSLRQTLASRDITFKALTQAVADARSAEAEHLQAGDINAAVRDRQTGDAATRMLAEVRETLDADRALVETYDFEAATVHIAALADERASIVRVLYDEDEQTRVILGYEVKRDEARKRLGDLIDKTAAAYADAANASRYNVEDERAKHAAGVDDRERMTHTGAYAPKPVKPSNNAAVIALERMKQGQRVSSPVRQAMAGSVGGPNLMPLDPQGACS
jgi:hypothetical protein